MNTVVCCVMALFILLTEQVYAQAFLSYPVAQPPECNQGYELAPEPKSFELVMHSLQQICIKRVRVIGSNTG